MTGSHFNLALKQLFDIGDDGHVDLGLIYKQKLSIKE